MPPAKAKAKPAANGNREQRRYRRPRTALLRFDDPEMEGLEVRCRRTTLGDALDLDELASAIDTGGRPEIEAFLSAFADRVLLSWNLDDEVIDATGEPTGVYDPVPTTLEGLLTQDLRFVMAIFTAWMESAVGVAAPLAPTSPAGLPSGLPSMPMETLTPSPES